jgi:thiol-disulfide isomerase/thioredoxin
MKKTFLIIAFLSVLLLSMSGFNDQRLGVMPGNVAPMLSLKNDVSNFNLSDYQGKYVLLSFWSSGDAKSRMLCNSYDAWVNSNDPRNEKVKLVGVNFDDNNILFSQIVLADNLNAKTQFNAKGKNAEKINSDYHLAAGYGTLLIGPDGRVVAANPSIDSLAQLVAE